MRQFWGLCLGLLTCATTASAQGVEGWQRDVGEGGMVSYTHPSNQAVIVESPAYPLQAHETFEQMVAILAKRSSNISQCRGLDSQPPQNILGGEAYIVQTQSSAFTCQMVIRKLGDNVHAVMSFSEIGFVDTQGAASRYLQRWLGMSSSTAKQAASAQGTSIQGASTMGPMPADIEAKLKKAVAEVPAANRPVTAVSKATQGFSGWPPMPTYTVGARLLFANGIATDCSDWDPGRYAPTQASVGTLESCDVMAWRRQDGAVQLQSSDGSWSGSDIAEGIFPFKLGERLDIAFGNISATGFNFGPGSIATSQISGSDLRMTIDGQIAGGNWSTTNISGANVTGYSANEDKPNIGYYYIDGYVIAIMDADGNIRRGFIGGVGGDKGKRIGHIYLNGTQYSDQDD